LKGFNKGGSKRIKLGNGEYECTGKGKKVLVGKGPGEGRI